MTKGIFSKMMKGELPMPKVAQTLGAKILEFDPGIGTIVVAFEATENFLNPVDSVQGEILAAMLDEIMGPALTATLGENEFASTLELKVNFIAAAEVGKLIGYGKILSKDRSVYVLDGELKQKGKLVAKSTATALIRQIKR